jgi:hypothetical protein
MYLYGLIGAVLLAAVAFVIADRRRATIQRHRFIVALALHKAKADGNWRVWLPVDKVEKVFKLSTQALTGKPATPNPKDYAGKAPRHPALSRPARREKM